jgi:Family of unknown function (DUF5996)
MTTSAPQPFVHRSSLVSPTAQVWNQPPASATRAANLTIGGRWPATTWYLGMGGVTEPEPVTWSLYVMAYVLWGNWLSGTWAHVTPHRGRRLMRGWLTDMELFPPMPLAEWQDTKATLHRFCQVVGKLRLAASVRRNHWWNVPFHLTGRGITTRPMGQLDGNPIFTIDFDFVDHQLRIHTLDGHAMSFPLPGQSVASFHRNTMEALATLGIKATITIPRPFDLPDADRPFADDTEHASYDPAWASRYWQVLSQVNLLMEQFAARFAGKVSPVHHFWHTFDLAHTRFSDRHIDQPPTADPVTREAYSREVISFGFWFGDDDFPEPAFYAYTAPEPTGLASEPLRPEVARWVRRNASHLAVLRYDEARAEHDPRVSVLDFYESAYQAGARRAGWDIQRLASPGGITDPVSRDDA